MKNLPTRMAKNALMIRDTWSVTPFHIVATNTPRSVIDRILSLAANAVRVKDIAGNLPFRYAADCNFDVDDMKLLVNAYPEAMVEKNKYGRIPLHDVAWNTPYYRIDLMLATAPNAACVKNSDG